MPGITTPYDLNRILTGHKPQVWVVNRIEGLKVIVYRLRKKRAEPRTNLIERVRGSTRTPSGMLSPLGWSGSISQTGQEEMKRVAALKGKEGYRVRIVSLSHIEQ
jgi:hypothetical protein